MIRKTIKISIVLCTYNGAKFLREQLDSILSQTYPIYEIIVQDDKSTDETCDIVRDYQRYYGNIKLYINKRHKWPSENFATAFKRAKGDIIAPCDQDDIWDVDKIEKMLVAINNNLVIYSQDRIISPNGIETIVHYGESYDTPWQFLFKSISGHTMLFRRELIPDIYYAVKCGLSFDYSIALLGVLKQSIVSYNKPLQTWRRHENVVTHGIIDQSKLIRARYGNRLGNVIFLLNAIWMIIKKSKVSSIEQRFRAIELILSYLKYDDNDLLMYCKNFACQSLLAMIKVGKTTMKHSNDIFGEAYSLSNKLKLKMYAFRFPFIYWYNHKDTNHL